MAVKGTKMKYSVIDVDNAVGMIESKYGSEDVIVIADPVRLEWLKCATPLWNIVKRQIDENNMVCDQTGKFTKFVDILNAGELVGQVAEYYFIFDYMGLTVEETYTLLLHLVEKISPAKKAYIVHGNYLNRYEKYVESKQDSSQKGEISVQETQPL
jgi:hypothetical protein